MSFCFVVFFPLHLWFVCFKRSVFPVLHEQLMTLNLVTKVKYIPHVSVQDRGLRRRHAPGCGTKLCQTLQLPDGIRTQWGAGLSLLSQVFKFDLQYHQIQLFTSSFSIFFTRQFHLEFSGCKYLETTNSEELADVVTRWIPLYAWNFTNKGGLLVCFFPTQLGQPRRYSMI